MLKNNKVAKAGLGYIIGNYFLKGLSFLTLPIFVRLMSTSDYGIYNSFLAYESIFFVIIGFAIHSSFKNAKYKYKEKYDQYISSSFLLLVISFIMWFLVVFLFSDFLIFTFKLDKISLYMLVLFSFSSAVINCINAYLALNFEYQNFLVISFINAVSNILLSIILINVVFSSARYLGRIIGTTIPAFIISTVLIYKFFLKEKPKNCIKYWKWGLSYSLPIVPHGVSQVILNQFDRIMIQNIIGASQAGIYSFAYNIYSIIQVTTSSLDNAWEPWFYEKMNNKDYQSISKRSSEYILGVLLFTILVMLFSPELITILGSKAYWDAKYSVLPIIGAGYFSYLYTLPSSVEYYYSKTKYIAIGTTGAAMLNIVLNFIFINQYGYIAAAYTTLVTYFVYFIIHYIISKKIIKENIFNIKVIVFASTCIFFTIIITLLFINNSLIRFCIGLIVLFFSFFIEEKKIGVLKKKIKKNEEKE